MIFDTETTSLDRPFCYDVGYYIVSMDTFEIVKTAHFVIEQVWHNLPLFESAYYKEKRPLYVQLLRAHKAEMKKWGHVTQTMIRDIKQYEITDAYAYNSDFDEKVFNFNCDWFKTVNPFDTVAIHDIWGYASQFITSKEEYKTFCEEHELFTETGNYKGSAEAVFRFISGNETFDEAHMGMYDTEIENEILKFCIKYCNAEQATDYKVNKIIPRPKKIPFVVKINGKTLFEGEYTKKYQRNNTFNFTVEE